MLCYNGSNHIFDRSGAFCKDTDLLAWRASLSMLNSLESGFKCRLDMSDRNFSEKVQNEEGLYVLQTSL